jgi:hypothetical protein
MSHHHFRDWLATATNLRLILFRTETSELLEVKPKPLCLEVEQWWFADLAAVSTGYHANPLYPDYFLDLTAHFGLGPKGDGEPRRYLIPVKIPSVSTQEQIGASFAPWLRQQVAAGAFPMDPERRARVERAHADRQARQQAQQHRAAESRARLRANLPGLIAWLVMLVGLGGLVAGGIFVALGLQAGSTAAEDLARDEQEIARIEADLAWARAGADPPTDCPSQGPKSSSRSSTRYCHGCRVFAGTPPADAKSLGQRAIQRGREVWLCPPASIYESNLASAQKSKTRHEKNVAGARTQWIAALAGSLVGVGVGVAGLLLLLRHRRRMRASS